MWRAQYTGCKERCCVLPGHALLMDCEGSSPVRETHSMSRATLRPPKRDINIVNTQHNLTRDNSTVEEKKKHQII